MKCKQNTSKIFYVDVPLDLSCGQQRRTEQIKKNKKKKRRETFRRVNNLSSIILYCQVLMSSSPRHCIHTYNTYDPSVPLRLFNILYVLGLFSVFSGRASCLYKYVSVLSNIYTAKFMCSGRLAEITLFVFLILNMSERFVTLSKSNVSVSPVYNCIESFSVF